MLSIITPVLNGRKYIQLTIESIQKLKIPYEHIVVDGGSTDGTIEYVKKFPDIKFLYQKENSGMYGAIHQGISEARGNYLTWVNSDDKVIAFGYEKMYNEMVHNNLDLVYSNGIHHFIDENRYKLVTSQPFARFFLKEGIFPFVQPSSIFSKKGYEKVGGFNFLKFKIIGDRDLFQKMAYDSTLKMKYVATISSVFLRYNESLLFRNLDLLKKEHNFTIKTNSSLSIRIIYHLFRTFKNSYWKIKTFKK